MSSKNDSNKIKKNLLPSHDQVLTYWFGADYSTQLFDDNYAHNAALWFKIDWQTDEFIRDTFGTLLEWAESGRLNYDEGDNDYAEWLTNERGTLALIIVLDQFSRNVYRGTAKMFANDARALELSLKLLNDKSCGDIQRLSLVEQYFAVLPLVHVENVEHTRHACELIQRLADRAPQVQRTQFLKYLQNTKVHVELMTKYGRYPHRNALLGRTSTNDELEFIYKSKHNFVKSVLPAKKPPHSMTTNQSKAANKGGKIE
jgi:uncharacterized protein (DUF924 family)